MIRILFYALLATGLVWSLRELFADWPPRRWQAAGWGLLSGGLIAAGSWMVLADLG